MPLECVQEWGCCTHRQAERRDGAEGGREGRGRGGKETERGGRVKEGREVGGSGINTHAIAAYCVR